MKIIFSIFLIIISAKGLAHKDTTTSPLTFGGYLETYYSYDFGKPANHTRPAFIYSHNRHNEVNLNLGIINATYNNENVRANLALMAGTYANANLAAEPGVLKNIYEANIGVKISKQNKLWIDAGIFTSHIGFESAIGKDCWNLTRNILSDNSPYYEAGLKMSYITNNGKWFMSALLLNGWQRIKRVDGNNSPAFGYQLTFKPNAKLTFNSSSFIGNDKPDSVKQMRYFHNFYSIFQFNKILGLITGIDVGAEQKEKNSKVYNIWYSPVIILKISPDAKNSIAFRAEYYSDKNGVIISSFTPNGFKTLGYSLNYDYGIRSNIVWRIEGRGFTGKDKTFEKMGKPTNKNFSLTSSLAISF